MGLWPPEAKPRVHAGAQQFVSQALGQFLDKADCAESKASAGGKSGIHSERFVAA